MAKLNGWQRLWCIAAVGLGILLGVRAVQTAPTEGEYHAFWRRVAELEVTSMVATPEVRARCREEAAQQRNRDPGDLYGSAVDRVLCEERLAKEATPPAAQARFAERLAQGEKEAQNQLPAAIAKHYAMHVLAWLLAAGGLYGAGLLVVWVWRGFRPETNP